ncbi:MAG: hypothetical protein ACREU7_15875, partial [Burkholderiales bacterium]
MPFGSGAKAAALTLMALDSDEASTRANAILDTMGKVLSLPKTPSDDRMAVGSRIVQRSRRMVEIAKNFLAALHSLFKSRFELQAEILVLRHQLNVLRRRTKGRPLLT